MSEDDVEAGIVAPGEYAPAGEAEGEAALFTAESIASAFGVAVERVRHAMAGEFGMGPNSGVDSRHAQHLAEVILGDLPLAEREAALMQLGAYTPRADHSWGIGEAAEESDKVYADAEQERIKPRDTHDPERTTA